MMKQNRAQRIADAEFKLMGIKLVIEPLQKQLTAAEDELKRAQESYDVGERVHVRETCPRGCCTELEYVGTIVAPSTTTGGQVQYGNYKVKRDKDGHVFEHVSTYDMKRLP